MEVIKQNYLSNLNKNQKEAILSPDGPCLVVAGAGSGKTKVLTSRVVHIIKEKKAWPNQILCVTFTNKAAKEMQNRITVSLDAKITSLPWLGTFHSVCAKLLRRHPEAVGLNSRFTIIDQEDQLRLIKNICKSENIDVKKISPKFILSFINQWKNKGLLPENVIAKKDAPLEKAILNNTDHSALLDEEKYILNSQEEMIERKEVILSGILNGKAKLLKSIVQNNKTKLIAVRFLEEVEEISGADAKKYGPFKPEDIATLPYENAQNLISKNSAVKIHWENQ